MSNLSHVICTGCTYIWLSIVPVQVARRSAYEAHILKTQAAESTDGELSSSPNSHIKSVW